MEIGSFSHGSLGWKSFVRPTKIFTGNTDLLVRTVGKLNSTTMNKITNTIIMVLQNALKNLGE
jgi:hypothetical protein